MFTTLYSRAGMFWWSISWDDWDEANETYLAAKMTTASAAALLDNNSNQNNNIRMCSVTTLHARIARKYLYTRWAQFLLTVSRSHYLTIYDIQWLKAIKLVMILMSLNASRKKLYFIVLWIAIFNINIEICVYQFPIFIWEFLTVWVIMLQESHNVSPPVSLARAVDKAVTRRPESVRETSSHVCVLCWDVGIGIFIFNAFNDYS